MDTDEFDKYELDELDEQLAFAVVYGDVSANRRMLSCLVAVCLVCRRPLTTIYVYCFARSN